MKYKNKRIKEYENFILKFCKLESEAMKKNLIPFLKPLNECKNELGNRLAQNLPFLNK